MLEKSDLEIKKTPQLSKFNIPVDSPTKAIISSAEVFITGETKDDTIIQLELHTYVTSSKRTKITFDEIFASLESETINFEILRAVEEQTKEGEMSSRTYHDESEAEEELIFTGRSDEVELTTVFAYGVESATAVIKRLISFSGEMDGLPYLRADMGLAIMEDLVSRGRERGEILDTPPHPR